jgi:hypothetical protein
MLSTSLALVVLSGVASASAAQPTWQSDYGIALAQAVKSNKPIAVFIAQGGAGYARVVAAGGLSTDDARLLKQHYICLYVNTESAKGKKLADAFEMKEGLVISGRAGTTQALRYDGKVPQGELSKFLTRYAEADRIVTTTDTPGSLAAASTVVVAQPAPVYYPQVRPVAAACST